MKWLWALIFLCNSVYADSLPQSQVVSQPNNVRFEGEVTQMSFPTTGILDNFNRSDTAPMTGWWDHSGGFSANGSTCQPVDASFNLMGYDTYFSGHVEMYLTMATKPGETLTLAYDEI